MKPGLFKLGFDPVGLTLVGLPTPMFSILDAEKPPERDKFRSVLAQNSRNYNEVANTPRKAVPSEGYARFLSPGYNSCWCHSISMSTPASLITSSPLVLLPSLPPTGHLVSGYVKQHLPIILVNHLTSDKDVKKALSLGFTEVDKSLGNSRIDCEFSGSTAVVSYLKVCVSSRIHL